MNFSDNGNSLLKSLLDVKDAILNNPAILAGSKDAIDLRPSLHCTNFYILQDKNIV